MHHPHARDEHQLMSTLAHTTYMTATVVQFPNIQILHNIQPTSKAISPTVPSNICVEQQDSNNEVHIAMQVMYAVCSGSEANDLALRVARANRPGAWHVAVVEGAYHGHTTATLDLSPYKFDGPGGMGKPPHVHVLPCPDVLRYSPGLPSQPVLLHMRQHCSAHPCNHLPSFWSQDNEDVHLNFGHGRRSTCG